MTTKEVLEYIMNLDKKYREACTHRQEALEILTDILYLDDLAHKDRAIVDHNKIKDWINKVPHMISSKNFRRVFLDE